MKYNWGSSPKQTVGPLFQNPDLNHTFHLSNTAMRNSMILSPKVRVKNL